MQRLCSFCESTDVVFMSGYHYCRGCMTRYEMTVIHAWLGEAFPDLSLTQVRHLCREAFGKDAYGFHDFPQLYKIIPRDKWNEQERCFEVVQQDYLKNVFTKLISEKHPQLMKGVLQNVIM